MELKCELAFVATCFWERSCWEGKWANDMFAAWKGRSLAQGPGKMTSGTPERFAASSGMREHWPAWPPLLLEIPLLKMVGVTAPSDISKFFVKSAKLLRWREMQIDEMENGVVV